MTKMGAPGPGARQPDHSIPEVLPTQYHGKVDFDPTDKVAFFPYREHDKVVAASPQPDLIPAPSSQPDLIPAPSPDNRTVTDGDPWSTRTFSQGGSTWDGNTARSEHQETEKRDDRICGLKRWIFFLILAIAALLVGIGVGVGVGVGVSARTRSSDAQADTVSSSTSSQSSSASATGSTTATTTPSTSSTSSAPQSTASHQIGGAQGRCVDSWGPTCICLDQNACNVTWYVVEDPWLPTSVCSVSGNEAARPPGP